MATEVKLPDLGEGIEDATISRWLVKVGDEVNAGDALLEVATDKVDTEVPAPASGKVLKINHGEGSLVALDTVIAVLGAEGESAESDSAGGDSSGGEKESKPEAKAETNKTGTEEIPAPDYGTADYRSPDADAAEEASEEADLPAEKSETPPQVATPSENGQGVKASPVAKRVAADKGVRLDGVSGTGPGGRITKGDVLATADGSQGAGVSALPGAVADVAPLSVLRLVAEYNLNIKEIAGDRPLSTLTRYDVLSALASRGAPVAAEPRFIAPVAVPGEEKPGEEKAVPGETGKATSAEESPAKTQPKEATAPAKAGSDEDLIKHTRMRQAIARNTIQSWTSAPHVTTVWDVDMSAVINHRKAHKNEFAAAGVNLTITAYFFEAIVAGLKAVPAANASYSDEGTIIKRNYNIGMAVALPQDENGLGGLIVPVIKNAGDLNLMGIARAVNDLADKARKNQLKADDLADGTFTLTNYGTSGSRMQTPIIIQPQAGILGVGAVEKRAVVISKGSPLEASLGDSLAFLPMTTLSFSYDHRVLDGATADAFCAAVKQALENYQ